MGWPAPCECKVPGLLVCRTTAQPLQRAHASLPVAYSEYTREAPLILLILLCVVLILVGLHFVLYLIGLVRFRLLRLLHLAELLPLLGEVVGFRGVVRDDDIVEDGAAFHLPQVEADETEIRKLVHGVIVHVLGIGDPLGRPYTLVLRVGDPRLGPFTLVLGVVLHRRLSLAVLLVVPIVRLRRLGVNDALLLDPVLRFLRLGVIHHGGFDPVAGLLVFRVIDLRGLQDFPVLLQGSLVDLLPVDFHSHRVVGLQEHPVQVRRALVLLLVGQVGLLQDVLARS